MQYILVIVKTCIKCAFTYSFPFFQNKETHIFIYDDTRVQNLQEQAEYLTYAHILEEGYRQLLITNR